MARSTLSATRGWLAHGAPLASSLLAFAGACDRPPTRAQPIGALEDASATSPVREAASAAPSAGASSAAPSAGASSAPGHAGTGPAPDAASTSHAASLECRVNGPKESVELSVSLESMTGKLDIVSPEAGTWHLVVRATPHHGTYSLVFVGYDPTGKKPARPKLVPGQSVVARLVSIGEEQRIYFDGDLPVPLRRPPRDGSFVCE